MFKPNGRSETVDLSWETRSQEKLQVVAHSEMTPGAIQYDLLIDGISFFLLPSREMAQKSSRNVVSPQAPSSITASEQAESRADSSIDVLSDEGSDVDPDLPYPDLGWRLSMAGLSTKVLEREPVDELHSDVYSSMVESLRCEITDQLPQAEALVSRAIIHAFFPDNDSETSPSDGSFSITERDPAQVEADSMNNAEEWAKLNLDYAPGADVEERTLTYFSKHVETLFSYVRNEELQPTDASRILLNVAAVLRLQFDKPLESETVLLQGFDKRIELDDFARILSAYGEVEAVAVSKSRRFGFCRFRDPSSLLHLKANAENGRLFMGGEKVYLTVLSEKVDEQRRGLSQEFAQKEDEHSDDANDKKGRSHRAKGSDSIPHLMGAMSNDEMMFSDPDLQHAAAVQRCVSDGWVDTGVYDDTKAPRQVSPDSVMHLKKPSFFTDPFNNGFLGEEA